MYSNKTDDSVRNIKNLAPADATIIGILGVVLIGLVLTGKLNNYLQPYFNPIMIITGIALVGLSAWTFLVIKKDWVGSAVEHEHAHSKTSWMLIVPLVLVVFFAPDPLGAALLSSDAVGGAKADLTVGRQGQQSQRDGRVKRNADGTIAYPTLEEGAEITLEELNDRFFFGAKEALDGKDVTLVGFSVPNEDGTAGWKLARFKIYCCAADAIPYRINVQSDQPVPAADEWFKVSGVIDASGDELVISPTNIEPITQPKTPYL